MNLSVGAPEKGRQGANFTAPSVSPATNQRPTNAKNTTTGRIDSEAPARSRPQSIWYWPMMPERPTGSVRFASEMMSTEANRYSVQLDTKAKIAIAAMPGLSSGTRM